MSRDKDCLRKFIAHQSLRVRLPVFVARARKEGWRKEALGDAISHIIEKLAALTLEDPNIILDYGQAGSESVGPDLGIFKHLKVSF